MMDKKRLTPLKKMSKKEQRAFYAQQRGSWNGLSPVTRIVPNKKVYDRKKAGRAFRRDEEARPDRFCA